MIIFIVAGGSGTRLWPLSTPIYPKHLLKINDNSRSLIQSAYDRASLITENIFVITENSHIDIVRKQLKILPENKFIIEPFRKGTANCITLALSTIKNIDENEPIAFIHADHLIRDKDSFKLNFLRAFKIVKKYNQLTLIGVPPTYPSTGFGYIQKGSMVDESLSLYRVKSFKEKPNLKIAKKYFDSGQYLWNSGYFIGTYKIFLDELRSNSPNQYRILKRLMQMKDRDDIVKEYALLENLAIDNVLIERMNNLLVIPAEFDWADLGSFGDLSTLSPKDHNGNTIKGNVRLEKSRSSYIYNDNDKPLVIIGMDNVVVVSTKNGTLITTKDLSQEVGDIAKKINEENK